MSILNTEDGSWVTLIWLKTNRVVQVKYVSFPFAVQFGLFWNIAAFFRILEVNKN